MVSVWDYTVAVMARGLKKGSLKEKHAQDQCKGINKMNNETTMANSRDKPKKVSRIRHVCLDVYFHLI